MDAASMTPASDSRTHPGTQPVRAGARALGIQRTARRALLIGVATAVCLYASVLAADPTGTVTVAGDVQRAAAFDADTLRAFPAAAQVSFPVMREVDGQAQPGSLVRGVRLLALLEQAELAGRDRFDWRKTVVVAMARDGYRAAFSWPELANTAGGAQVMVAYERDGAPLSEAEGPLAIHAPGDTRSGPRHVKWLQRIEVRILRD
jgi:DMSO/TMAO reductase YedYZ molybdopterin-dependent catalytic subunit